MPGVDMGDVYTLSYKDYIVERKVLQNFKSRKFCMCTVKMGSYSCNDVFYMLASVYCTSPS